MTEKIIQKAARITGSKIFILITCIISLIWCLLTFFHLIDDTLQLQLNLGLSLITFIAALLIQHSQNNDTTALHIKLDELLRAANHARNELIDIETADTKTLQRVKREVKEMA